MNEDIKTPLTKLHHATEKACGHWAPIVRPAANEEGCCQEDAGLQPLPVSSSDASGKSQPEPR